MAEQISMFDGSQQFKITKPIRLIECFAGYGSQALALKYLGANFEHWKIAEWAVKSIQAYKDIHFTDDNTDYNSQYDKEWLIDYLFTRGISADYNKPMTREQIARMGEPKIRTVYNNIIATHNLVSVCNVRGEDLEITDTDNFTYLLTYSFPCQDLSLAGNRKGMGRDSGTRSGLLWEIERILKECHKLGELPQVLLMENVTEVHGTKNKEFFYEWLNFLESIGYKSKWQDLNAKNYGVPQNRDRTFVLSVLGDYYTTFPDPIKLEKRLKDVLETEVDEKYYLSDKTIDYFVKHTKESEEKGNGFRFEPTAGGGGYCQSNNNPCRKLDGRQLHRGGKEVSTMYMNYKKIDKVDTDVAKTLCARDYKGFGTEFDTMNAVLEKPLIIKPAHGYYKGEVKQDDVFPTIDTGTSANWHCVIGEPKKDG